MAVWRKGHELVMGIYQGTALFPPEERQGLAYQLRKAAASICANMAEGCGRRGSRELSRFLQIAFASACEVEYLLFLSGELGYMGTRLHEQLSQQLLEVKKMLASFIHKLRRGQPSEVSHQKSAIRSQGSTSGCPPPTES